MTVAKLTPYVAIVLFAMVVDLIAWIPLVIFVTTDITTRGAPGPDEPSLAVAAWSIGRDLAFTAAVSAGFACVAVELWRVARSVRVNPRRLGRIPPFRLCTKLCGTNERGIVNGKGFAAPRGSRLLLVAEGIAAVLLLLAVCDPHLRLIYHRWSMYTSLERAYRHEPAPPLWEFITTGYWSFPGDYYLKRYVFHRDSLVRVGALVCREYSVGRIAVPSSDADRLLADIERLFPGVLFEAPMPSGKIPLRFHIRVWDAPDRLPRLERFLAEQQSQSGVGKCPVPEGAKGDTHNRR